MKLREIFSPELIRQPSSAKEKSRVVLDTRKDYSYRIKVGNLFYRVDFAQFQPGVFGIDIDFKYDIPASEKPHHAQQLFTEVIKVLVSFLKRHQPQRVEFSPSGESRTKLYLRLLRRYAPHFEQQGYRAIMPASGQRADIALQRIEK